MELADFIQRVQNTNFKKITWIYLNSKSVAENKAPDLASETLPWVPSKHAGTMAGATGFGDIVRGDRTIVTSFDGKLLGVYKIEGSIRVGETTVLTRIVDLKNASVGKKSGAAAGTYLLKEDFLKLLTDVQKTTAN